MFHCFAHPGATRPTAGVDSGSYPISVHLIKAPTTAECIFVPEGQHDRSQARSAWKSVPQMYRPVGHGMIGRSQSQRYFSWKCAPCRIGAHICTNHTVPYGTALWVGAVPGTSCQATITLSLRDKSHSPIEEPRIKLALMGLKPREPRPPRRTLKGCNVDRPESRAKERDCHTSMARTSSPF
jgi:hypothetical protein